MQAKSLFLLGRQPAIGLAELESVLGAEHLRLASERIVACDLTPNQINFSRLGGSVRLARPIAQLQAKSWPQMLNEMSRALAGILDTLPLEGKIKLGVSAIDISVGAKQLFAAGLTLKKVCKQQGRSVRLVPNNEPELNTAQVLHNQLTGELGVELLLLKDGRKTLLAQTVAIQDIEAYARRDQGRPKRDAFVGMLPPKLAQIIVNLAVGQGEPADGATILDPFCGTGVVLQEALLMGYGAYGTDLEPRMIDYSRQNLEWLATHGVKTDPLLEVGDATNHSWQDVFKFVACETYLGRPLSNWPKPETLQEIIGNCNVIIEKFLRNIGDQIQPGTRLCLAVPCWIAPDGTKKHLPMLDQLGKMRYNRIRFEHSRDSELVYYRPDQIVARELLVITKE
jgi:tRNA G10  N-methylase Trm11